MKHFLRIAVILCLGITSCKSKKTVTDNSLANISTKKIINNHIDNKFNEKTVSAKLNVKYKDKKTAASVVIKLRIEKDSAIWMSATKLGFPIAKLMVTPNRVSYYEKIKKTYFDGDFSLLSNWLGTELDFEKFQNMLLGEAVLNLKKDKYNNIVEANSYMLQPKRENDLFQILFFVNPYHFKLDKQEIRQAEKGQYVTVSYPSYENYNGVLFPEEININAVKNQDLTSLNIAVKSVELNTEVSFPFSIPNGYKQIQLK